MNAPATQQVAIAPQPRQQLDFGPQTFDQALIFCDYLADSEMVPKDFRGKPGNCLIAIQWGAELGLKPLQAIQNIAIINGRPSLWGDAVLALVRSSPLCEYVKESDDGHTATCRAKRRGEDEVVGTFSIDDARTAGLFGKAGTWTQYPARMRKMRARAFALRDAFTDVIKGMAIAEEIMDIQPGAAAEAQRTVAVRTEPVDYSADDFEKNLPTWLRVIAEGKRSADDIIAMAETKGRLTEDQKSKIRGEADAEEAEEIEQ
jgi:hypothetical protein